MLRWSTEEGPTLIQAVETVQVGHCRRIRRQSIYYLAQSVVRFLTKKCSERGASVTFATHIFDQQNAFEGLCPYTADCAASEMFKGWQEHDVDCPDELVRVLGTDLTWWMNQASDGQRKKVRIMIKLLKPFQVCIIDEFAADLDTLSRSLFKNYLSRECATRGSSVVYATHIFDQADNWASHIMFMQLDRLLSPIYDLQTFLERVARNVHVFTTVFTICGVCLEVCFQIFKIKTQNIQYF
uniref:ABC transporter domain-containing protein n=1 Tax=Proboscia inermis TaxID=420281 RepID=A0A7S0CJW3_9STRA|mmetsp:Transcript_53174/g.53585  ORF Transcript_53174/g.53585 Transcript_53174/m.53585 type:complete len:240 (+) Transcript_53174:133-852(+)